MIPPCFAHPSRDVPLRVRVPHPCAVMGAPSAFGRPRTLCTRLRDHVPPSVPRPFSAAGTLCCGPGERTLPILACWFLFSVKYSKNYTASAKFCQGKPPAGKTAELLLVEAITNERRQLSVFHQDFFFMSLQFSIHFGIVQTILITRITPI